MNNTVREPQRAELHKTIWRIATDSENDYSITVSSYVEQKDTHEVVDIKELNAEIAHIVARQQELRGAIDAIVVDIEGEAV